MEQVIVDHLISLGFEDSGQGVFKKQEITITHAENAYHLSFYLDPFGDITLVNRIDERRFLDIKINNFIDCVQYVKNKLY
jgi:hypothetical protein